MKLLPLGLLYSRFSTTVSCTRLTRPNIFYGTQTSSSYLLNSSALLYKHMVEIKEDELLSSMRSRVQEQGDKVRALKKENAAESELKHALSELKYRKKILEEKELELMPPIPSFDRGKLEDLLKQKFFYDQSFAIYGGVQGLYDFGPMGCAMKANLLGAWRQHFILEDHLLEVDCAILTPAPVLQASGHVERFTDLMVKDVKTGECFRADHFVKGHLEAKQNHKKTSEAEKFEIQKLLVQLDNLGSKELDAIIRLYEMKSTSTNNEVSEPQEFNLMFATMIGPTGQYKGYLRPETAQGIFVNFQRLLQFNQGRIPFGAAQIGSAFRNEISPRSGLIRVREFTMAEIEYFVDPNHKDHPKFDAVRNIELSLYSACDQMDGRPPVKMTIGEAVSNRIVANETLGYFMARIHLFLLHVGVDGSRLRFRQHLSNEMAHYASDCWDAECLTSYGWIECVGCADRSCYDLLQHTKATGSRLVAEKRLSEPRTIQVCECVPNKQEIGKAFRADAKSITSALAALTFDDATRFKQDLSQTGQSALNVNGKSFKITEPMVKIKEYEQTLHVEEVVPNVIEPSFGIGRVLYAVFEHSFRIRDGDEQRTYLSVPPVLAPYKCSVLPLSNHPDFTPFIKQISSALTSLGISHRVDESSGSIGRRYARTDQIAIPYGITIDFDTVNKPQPSATLRERDSMKQIRVPLNELPTLVYNLSIGQSDWTEVQAKYPTFEQQETGLREECTAKTMDEQQQQTKSDPPTKPNNPSKTKAGGQKRKNQKSAQPKQPVQEKLDPAVQTDDWQSVSEDLGDDHKDVYPDDIDNWSSATETITTEPIVKPEIQKVKNEKSTNETEHHEPIDNTANIREYSTSAVAQFVPKTEENTSLTWSNWGKAVRKHYEEEERREKNVVTAVEASRNEPRSSFSGYEADHEDNVISKSGFTIDPNKPKDQASLYNVFDCFNDDNNPSIEKEANHPTENQLNNTDTDFPPLPVTSAPHHGLFVGHGWPGEKSKSIPQLHSKPLVKNVENTKKVVKSTTTTVKTTLPEESGEWTSVMAHVLDNTCEPDMWKMRLNEDVTQEKLEPRNPTEDPQQTKKSIPQQVPTTSVVETTDNAYHGLFTGAGWPSEPVKSKITKSKLSTHQHILKEENKQINEMPSTINNITDDWQFTLAKMYETSLVEDKWRNEFHMNLNKLCDATRLPDEIKLNESCGKVVKNKKNTVPEISTPSNLRGDQIIDPEPIEDKIVTPAPSLVTISSETNPAQPAVIVGATAVESSETKNDPQGSTSIDANLEQCTDNQIPVTGSESIMTTSTKKNKKRKSKRNRK